MLNRKLHAICLILCAIFLLSSSAACGDDGSTKQDKSAISDDPDAGGGDASGADAGGGDATGSNPGDAGTADADASGGNDNPGDDITDCLIEITTENLELTNQARAEEGLGALSCDLGLTRAATLHARDMCEQDYFDHQSLDGRTFRDRIDAMGVQWRGIGENIAHGYTTAATVHTGWMNSPGHRANIMSPDFGRIGIGYVHCGGRPYWVQNFAN